MSATPPRRHPLHGHGDVLLAAAAGGALGSLARWALTQLVQPVAQLPAATWLANVTGAAALGVLLATLIHRFPTARHVRGFWGVGVLGGYTTFSSVMLELHTLLLDGESLRAAAYAVGTVATGLAAAALGWTLTARLLAVTPLTSPSRHEQPGDGA